MAAEQEKLLLEDDSNLFEWSITIMGSSDTPYEGGYFNVIMKFTSDYSNSSPMVKFGSEMWHASNWEGPHGYEFKSKHWTPVLSIISMLSSPYDESPVNVGAAIKWRD
uniref:UBC core domain-containing protein n=1 Tax=Nelumbo nucifera TaxID=4432 RepID=A0A822Z2Z1_NELNU|nr:TPA_asm: hypothetical protein HUJ06_006508 [Nelumbo nucifera]